MDVVAPRVVEGSSAALAGVQLGDELLEIAGIPVAGCGEQGLQKAASAAESASDELVIQVRRSVVAREVVHNDALEDGITASLPGAGYGPSTLEIEIPPGSEPGQTLTVSSLRGEEIVVVVPSDAEPGDTISVPLVASDQSADALGDPLLGMEENSGQRRIAHVTIPPGAVGGEIIEVDANGGQVIQVQLPDDVTVGESIEVTYEISPALSHNEERRALDDTVNQGVAASPNPSTHDSDESYGVSVATDLSSTDESDGEIVTNESDESHAVSVTTDISATDKSEDEFVVSATAASGIRAPTVATPDVSSHTGARAVVARPSWKNGLEFFWHLRLQHIMQQWCDWTKQQVSVAPCSFLCSPMHRCIVTLFICKQTNNVRGIPARAEARPRARDCTRWQTNPWSG